jgi:hypothetical protein
MADDVLLRIEYVALSKDVIDADLKQRRELTKGTSYYVDQAAVRAAIHGRILILDGIEKAERNVLPILNNLLENREMALEDGRFLTNKDISNSEPSNPNYLKFEKVHDRFLVFALGKMRNSLHCRYRTCPNMVSNRSSHSTIHRISTGPTS